LSKRNILNIDDKINSGGLSKKLVIPLMGSKVQPEQVPRTNDAISSGSASTNENPILGGRAFSPPVVSRVQ
jgi:CCR4-NOT transcription complex subunit 3